MENEPLYYNALLEANVSYAQCSRLKRKGSWATAWENLRTIERNAIDPEKSFRALTAHGVELIMHDDPRYPALLREMAHPPHGIYVKGMLPSAERLTLGIVGTRKATEDGVRTARESARTLVAQNIVIVSGLALGIDRAAHMGALEGNGITLAVLGNGLDHVYPHTNERLAEEIVAKGGALISEYPLRMPSLPHHFLERNRIISGLSRGVLVIEAPNRSGSLATARFALEDNREVFVFPGPVSHPNYQGSLALLRQGARLVRNTLDVLEDMGLAIEEKRAAVVSQSPEAQKIIEALTASSRPLDIDALIEATGIPVPQVSQHVSLLLLQGTIKDNNDGYIL